VILIFAILSFFSFCRGGRAPPSQVLGEGARPAAPPPSCASENGLTDWAQILCGTSRDPREGL